VDLHKGRDLAQVFGRARAEQPLLKGKPATLLQAVGAARGLIAEAAGRWRWCRAGARTEELAAFKRALAKRFACFVKADHRPAPGEVVQDELLIRADKNRTRPPARELFGAVPLSFPTAPTWCWCGARASTFAGLRAAQG